MNTELPREYIDAYLTKIKDDYLKFWGDRANEAHIKEMIAAFNGDIRLDFGNKYVKVMCGNSAHSFICLKDNNKFLRGDILKAASWRGPATNFARGNIIQGNLERVRWTGAA